MKNLTIIMFSIFFIGCGGGGSSDENKNDLSGSIETIGGQELPSTIPPELKDIAKKQVDLK